MALSTAARQALRRAKKVKGKVRVRTGQVRTIRGAQTPVQRITPVSRELTSNARARISRALKDASNIRNGVIAFIKPDGRVIRVNVGKNASGDRLRQFAKRAGAIDPFDKPKQRQALIKRLAPTIEKRGRIQPDVPATVEKVKKAIRQQELKREAARRVAERRAAPSAPRRKRLSELKAELREKIKEKAPKKRLSELKQDIRAIIKKPEKRQLTRRPVAVDGTTFPLSAKERAIRQLENPGLIFGLTQRQIQREEEKFKDSFRRLPGLKGDNIAQRVTRQLLSFPARVVFLGTESLTVSARDARDLILTATTPKGRQILKKVAKPSAKEAVSTTGQGLKSAVSTPEGLTDLIIEFLITRRLLKQGSVTNNAKKTTAADARGAAGKAANAYNNIAKVAPDAKTRTVFGQVAKRLNEAKNNPKIINRAIAKIKNAAAKVEKRAAGKEAVRLGQKAKIRQAGEIIRKIKRNEKLTARAKKFKNPRLAKKLQEGTKSLKKRLDDLKLTSRQKAKARAGLRRQAKFKKRAKRRETKRGDKILKKAIRQGRQKKPRLKVRATIKLKEAVKRKVKRKLLARKKRIVSFVNKNIRLPTNKVIRNLNTQLNRFGFRVSRVTLKTLKPVGKGARRSFRSFSGVIRTRAIKPLSKSAKRALGRVQDVIRRTGKFTTSNLQRLNNVLVKAGYKIATKGRKVKRAVVKSQAAATRAIFKAQTALLKRIDAVVSPVGLRVAKFSRVTSRAKLKVTKTFLRKTRELKALLRRGVKRTDRRVSRLIREINKSLPFTIKIVAKTKKGKVLSFPRRFIRRGKRKAPPPKRTTQKIRATRTVAEARLILKGKKKLTAKTPQAVRKLVRRKRIQAEIKRRKGRDPRTIAQRKAKGKTAKQVRRDLARKRIIAKHKAERRADIQKLDRKLAQQKTEKFLGPMRARRDISIAQKQALALARILSGRPVPKSALAKQSFKRAAASTEKLSNQGQLLVLKKQKVDSIAKKVNDIKKAPTKAKADAGLKKANAEIKSTGQNLITLLEKQPVKARPIAAQMRALSVAAATARANHRQAVARSTRTGIKTKAVVAFGQKQRRKVVQKQGQVESTITIPASRINIATLPQTRQSAIIGGILASLAGGTLLGKGGRRINLQGKFAGGIFKFKQRVLRALRKRKFAFTPDIYSIIFGVRVKAGQKFKLLRPGRAFTGLERRPQIR